MKDTFLYIIQSPLEKELIPFLKTLTPEEKKKLAPVISRTIKEYDSYTNGRITGSYAQFRMLGIAAFVCFNLKDFVRNQIRISYLKDGFIRYHEYSEPHYINNQLIDEIMEWYCPDWLSEFLNDRRKNQDFCIARYEELMRWQKKGYTTLTPELIAFTLSQAYYETYYDEQEKKALVRYSPEKLYQYPETLQEHIWYLFQYPSEVSDGYVYRLDYKAHNWTILFKDLIKKGDINRFQLLQACLQTVNYDFKKANYKWFIELFNELEPTRQELLALQNEICTVLQQGEDKMLSETLNRIKSICGEPEFNTELFMQSLLSLLASPLKSTVNYVLDIFLKIVDKHTIETQTIDTEMCNVLLHKDEKLQKKAFRFIQTHGNEDTKAIVSSYSATFHPGIRPLIEEYLGEAGQDISPTIPQEEKTVITPTRLVREDNRIPEIESFEDFIYFVANIFEPGEPWRCFLLPEYLSRFRQQINADTLGQFEPIIKNANKACSDPYNNKASLIHDRYHAFLVGWVKQQLKKYPEAPASIRTLVEKTSLHSFNDRLSEIILYYFLLIYVADLLKKEEPVELLSTPTHTPLWIDPVTLVRRIKGYQDKGKQLSTPDLQLAIMRCARDYTDEAIALAEKELQGELKELILFLFGKRKDMITDTNYPAWWLTASLTRDPSVVPTHIVEWRYPDVPENYLQNRFPWEIKEQQFPYVGVTKGIVFDLPDYTPPAVNNVTCAYAFVWARKENAYRKGDVSKMIQSTPYNHDKLIAEVIASGKDFKTLDSWSKPRMLGALNGLIELYIPYTGIDYLLIITGMLAPDREVRDLAAALWIKMATQPIFDNEQLGRILAEVTASEWLPFKRFVDLVNLNFQGISISHTKQLITCINAFILNLDIPVKGVKPLLDTYHELLSGTQTTVSKEVKEKLESWKQQMPGLKKQIERICNIQ